MTTATEANKFDPTRELTNHPLADIFPLMEGPEFDALVEDIKLNWLREPITLHEDKILDGRNRYRAIVKANLRYKLKEENFRQFDPKTQGDPMAFVISANLHRRHLTESQRGYIAATVVTTKVGFNQYNKSGVTAAQAAKLLGVSEALVTMGKTVVEKASPEIKEKVQKGELRLGMAKSIVEKPKDQQQAELDRIKAERAAKAKAQKAARATGAKQRVSEANQAMTDVDEAAKKWRGFNDMQRRAFVNFFRAEIAKVLTAIDEEDRMRGSLNLGTQNPSADAA
jgi:hypothetical protein